MSQVYEASVYSREVSFKNFKGETKTQSVHFALDPLELMRIIASVNLKPVKSGNPSRKGEVEPMTDEQQIKFIRDLAEQAAGWPSEDGDSWVRDMDFPESLAGRTFITKLAASDGDRQEFSQKVLIAPFEAFVNFASADPTNTPKDVQELQQMLVKLKSIFQGSEGARAGLSAVPQGYPASNQPSEYQFGQNPSGQI